jgi:hypothetical protein
MVRAYPETHQTGLIDVSNLDVIFGEERQCGHAVRGDIGVQIANDGRIWVCVNGVALIRFSPHPDGRMQKNG